MTGIPRTWKQVRNHPAVESVENLPDEDVRYWIHLKPGFSAAGDPGHIHSGNGATIAEAIADTFPVTPCHCEDCKR